MFKYSFYSLSLRKFEVDQFNQIEEQNLVRDYMLSKLKSKKVVTKVKSDEALLKVLENEQ